jgi:outer membrane protein TolC
MVVAADEPDSSAVLPDGPSTLQAALAQNPQLDAVRAQLRAASIEIDVTENALLPQLDFSFTGGPMGNASTVTSAYSQMTGLGGYTVRADAVFQQPLGSHAARGARAAAREKLLKAHLDEVNIVAQVSTAVAHEMAASKIAHQQVEVLAHSIDAAEMDLEAEKARFEAGRSTSFDVLRRQDSLAAVQLVLLRAQVDYLKALANVEAATGEIAGRYGIVLR